MNALRLLKYVRSFVDGRVRLRHPALRNENVLQRAAERLRALEGVQSVEGNAASGSVLIVYDSERIPRDRVIALGEAWATYLDNLQAGKPAEMPSL